MWPVAFSSSIGLHACRDEVFLPLHKIFAVIGGVEVVDHQGVDRVDRQALQGLFIGAHDPVVGIVELHLEIQSPGPGRTVERFRVGRAMQRAADLCGQQDFVAGLRAQEAAEPVFGQAAAAYQGAVS